MVLRLILQAERPQPYDGTGRTEGSRQEKFAVGAKDRNDFLAFTSIARQLGP
jgi:hypothetical protein